MGRCAGATSIGDAMLQRLFGGKPMDPSIAARIPPGQYRTEKFPVLHYGSVPRTDLATWDFRVFGAVDSPLSLTWDQFKALPRKQVETDIHCVTRWTKLDTGWEGVADPGDPRARRGRSPRRLTSWPTASRATRRTCRWRSSTTTTSSWPTRSTGSRSSPSTAGRSASSSRSATSGRAPSGSAAWSSSTTTSSASGSATATTTTPTPGRKSDSASKPQARAQRAGLLDI